MYKFYNIFLYLIIYGINLNGMIVKTPQALTQCDILHNTSKATQTTVELWNSVNKGNISRVRDLTSHNNVNTYVWNPGPRNFSSLLHAAAWLQHEHIVSFLIRKGANVNIKNANHHTPLDFAAERSSVTIVKTLIDSGADVTSRALYKQAFARKHAYNSEISNILIQYGANARPQEANRYTILHAIADQGRSDMVHHVAPYFPDINIPDGEDYVPSTRAAFYRNVETMRTILAYGKNSMQREFAGSSVPAQLALQRTADPNYNNGNMCLERLYKETLMCPLCYDALYPSSHHRLTCGHGICHKCWRSFANWCNTQIQRSTNGANLECKYYCPLDRKVVGVRNISKHLELERALRDLGQRDLNRARNMMKQTTDDVIRNTLKKHAYKLNNRHILQDEDIHYLHQ